MPDLGAHRFDIHGLLHLVVDSNSPWRTAWLASRRDVLAVGRGDCPLAPDAPTLRLCYDKQLPLAGMVQLKQGVFARGNAVYDAKYRVRLESPQGGILELYTDNPAQEWISWGIQLALLAAGGTFVHAAGLERDGQVLMLASWANVGKTAIVASLVRDHGWNLLGDDLVILTADGMCYAFPKPLVIGSYHRQLYPDLFRNGPAPKAPAAMNDFLSHLAFMVKPALRRFPLLLHTARRFNPRVVEVLPSDIFGTHRLCAKAPLHRLLWIDRLSGTRTPKLIPSDADFTSRLMGSTIGEFDQRCVSICNLAMGLGMIDATDYYESWATTLHRGLKDAERGFLHLPPETDLTVLGQVIHSLID